jgi:hypothetical protein
MNQKGQIKSFAVWKTAKIGAIVTATLMTLTSWAYSLADDPLTYQAQISFRTPARFSCRFYSARHIRFDLWNRRTSL